jgi:hypothetical protein
MQSSTDIGKVDVEIRPTGTKYHINCIQQNVWENCTLPAFELSINYPLVQNVNLVCHKRGGYPLRQSFAPIRSFDKISPSTRFPSEMLLARDNRFAVIVYELINKRHRHGSKRRHGQPNSFRYFIVSRNSILMGSGNISGRVATYSSSLI